MLSQNINTICIFNSNSKITSIIVVIIGVILFFVLTLLVLIVFLLIVYYILNKLKPKPRRFFIKESFIVNVVIKIIMSPTLYSLARCTNITFVVYFMLFFPFSFFEKKRIKILKINYLLASIESRFAFFKRKFNIETFFSKKMTNLEKYALTTKKVYFLKNFKKKVYFYFFWLSSIKNKEPIIELKLPEKLIKEINNGLHTKDKIEDYTLINLKEPKDNSFLKEIFFTQNGCNYVSSFVKEASGRVVIRVLYEEEKLFELLKSPIGIHIYNTILEYKNVKKKDNENINIIKQNVSLYLQFFLGIYIQYFYLILKKLSSKYIYISILYIFSIVMYYNYNGTDGNTISLVSLYTICLKNIFFIQNDKNLVLSLNDNHVFENLFEKLSLSGEVKESIIFNSIDYYNKFICYLDTFKQKIIHRWTLLQEIDIMTELEKNRELIQEKFIQLLKKYLGEGKSYEEACRLAYQELITFVKNLLYFLGVTLGDMVYILLIIGFLYKIVYLVLEKGNFLKHKEYNSLNNTSDILEKFMGSKDSLKDGVFTVYFPPIEVQNTMFNYHYDNNFPSIGKRILKNRQNISIQNKENYVYDVTDPVTALEEVILVNSDQNNSLKKRTYINMLEHDDIWPSDTVLDSNLERSTTNPNSYIYKIKNILYGLKRKELSLGKTFENSSTESYIKYVKNTLKSLKCILEQKNIHTYALTQGVALTIGSQSAFSDVYMNEIETFKKKKEKYSSAYGIGIDSTLSTLSSFGTKGGAINMDRLIIINNISEYLPLPRIMTITNTAFSSFKKFFSRKKLDLETDKTDITLMKDASTLMVIAGSLFGLTLGSGNRYVAGCGSCLTLTLGLDNFSTKLKSYLLGKENDLLLLHQDKLNKYTKETLTKVPPYLNRNDTKSIFEHSLQNSILSVTLIDPIMTVDSVLYSKNVLKKLNLFDKSYIFSSGGKSYKRIINMYDSTLPCSNALAWGIPNFYYVYLTNTDFEKYLENIFPVSHAEILKKMSLTYIGSAITYLELSAKTTFSDSILNIEKKELYIPKESLDYESNLIGIGFEHIIGIVLHIKQIKELTSPLISQFYQKILYIYSNSYLKDKIWKSKKKKKSTKPFSSSG